MAVASPTTNTNQPMSTYEYFARQNIDRLNGANITGFETDPSLKTPPIDNSGLLAAYRNSNYNQVDNGSQQIPILSAKNATNDYLNKQADFNQINQGVTGQALAISQQRANQAAQQQANTQANTPSALDVSKQKAEDAKTAALNQATNALTGKPTDTTDPNKKLTPAEQQTGQTYANIQADMDKAAKSFNDSVNALNSGTFPLTPGQNAQLTTTRDMYNDVVRQIQQSYQGTLQGTNVLNARTGISQYAPGQALGNLQNVMNDMTAKIRTTEIGAAKALSDLQAGFETQDYKQIQDSYDAMTKALDKKSSILDKLNDQILKQANQALDEHKQAMADQRLRESEALSISTREC